MTLFEPFLSLFEPFMTSFGPFLEPIWTIFHLSYHIVFIIFIILKAIFCIIFIEHQYIEFSFSFKTLADNPMVSAIYVARDLLGLSLV